jgi:hypothetical protein
MLSMSIDDTGKVTGSTSRGLYLTLLTGLQRIVVANAHGTSKGTILVENFSRQMSKLVTYSNFVSVRFSLLVSSCCLSD